MGVEEARTVAAAAAATRAAGSARILLVEFLDPLPPSGWPGLTTRSTGVGDLARGRTQVEIEFHGAAKMARTLFERFPWLRDGDDEEDGPSRQSRVYVQGDQFDAWPYGWRRNDAADARDDPTWILRALAAAQSDQRAVGPETVESVATTRYCGTFRDGDDAFAADTWIDAEGRIRRATWSPVRTVVRTRHVGGEPPMRSWRTLELSEFGLEVAIEIPVEAPEPASDPRPLWRAGRCLWRRRRDYRREQKRRLMGR